MRVRSSLEMPGTGSAARKSVAPASPARERCRPHLLLVAERWRRRRAPPPSRSSMARYDGSVPVDREHLGRVAARAATSSVTHDREADDDARRGPARRRRPRR